MNVVYSFQGRPSLQNAVFNVVCLVISTSVLNCSKGDEKVLPQERKIVESVYSSVIVQPDSLYQVYAVVSGILEENIIEEGAIVSRNTALLQVRNNRPKLNTENAHLALMLAQENYNGNAAVLKGIQDEILAATLKYKNDSINYFRQKNLWEQKIGSKVEYDTKELNYRLSSNNLNRLQSRYNRTERELETALKQARNSYESSLINTKDFTVKSKMNGKVYALYKEPGELVSTMEPLALVGSSNTFVINMLVDEVDIVRIAKDQEVLIRLDAYNDEIFKGKVTKIYPKKDERNQTFTVEAVFDAPPTRLYPGLSGEANIVIAIKEEALTIPKEYLVNDSQVKTSDGIVTIKTGLQNLGFVEVVTGITKDTYIYKPD